MWFDVRAALAEIEAGQDPASAAPRAPVPIARPWMVGRPPVTAPHTVSTTVVRPWLSPQPPPPPAKPDPADLQAELDERAAMAAEGGVPAVYAEAFARLQVAPPPRVPLARWQQFIDDAGRFFDRWGAEAERLGWPVEDVLGLHDVAPLSRHDCMGLVWSLQGRPVLSLTERTATVETRTGAIQTWRRPARSSR